MIVIRKLVLYIGAALFACVAMWVAWSWVASPAPISIAVPDERTPTLIIPQPMPGPDIEPSFDYLSNAPVDQGRIEWAAVYTLAVLADIAYADAEEQQQRAKAIGAVTVHPLAVGSSEGFVASDDVQSSFHSVALREFETLSQTRSASRNS